MTANDLHELLVSNGLILEGARPNTSGEYIAKCFACDKKKMFVHCGDEEKDNGVYFCQHCEEKVRTHCPQYNWQNLPTSLAPW